LTGVWHFGGLRTRRAGRHGYHRAAFRAGADLGGWRIPFLIAGSLGIIGLYVRTRLDESPAYERQTKTRGQEQRRLSEQFRSTMIEPWRLMLICVGLVLAYNVTNYTLTQYMPTYLSATLGLPKTPALLVGLAVMVVLMVLITFAAR
jgi:MFS transporter, MHS family, proline/betaine transporter